MKLPQSIVNLEDWGLVSELDQELGIKIIRTQDEVRTPDLISFEYEVDFRYSPARARQVREYLSKEHKVEISKWADLFAFFLNYMQIHLREIAYRVYLDGAYLLEFASLPMTLEAHKRLSKVYEAYLGVVKAYGANVSSGEAGIHIGVNNGMITQEGLENFLWFAFRNNEFIVSMSNRQTWVQTSVDIYSLLDDPFGLLSDIELIKIFKERKKSLLNALLNGIWTHQLNLSVNKKGKRYLEIRWFGSTDEVSELQTIIQFIHSLILFSNYIDNEEEATLENYCAYVYENAQMYIDLFLKLKINSWTKEIINNVSPAVTKNFRKAVI